MFNTAPIMDWCNTTLLCYFMDFYTLMKNANFFDCKDLKTGGGIQRFYGQSVDFMMRILCSNETLHHGDFGLKSMDSWAGSILGVKIFYTKKSYQHNVDNSK